MLVIVGDDQYELFRDEHMPAIVLYYGETILEREFDVSSLAALEAEQHEGHAYSFVHRWYLRILRRSTRAG